MIMAFHIQKGWIPANLFNHSSWIAVVTPTDSPKVVHNRCVIEVFTIIFYLSFLF